MNHLGLDEVVLVDEAIFETTRAHVVSQIDDDGFRSNAPIVKFVRRFAAATGFALALASGGAGSSAEFGDRPGTRAYPREAPNFFAQGTLAQTWANATSLIRAQGRQPDAVLEQAAANISGWKKIAPTHQHLLALVGTPEDDEV